MAIDSRNKRASTVMVARTWTAVFPNPDGSLASAADRQHMGYAYAGIDAGSAPAGDTTVVLTGGFMFNIGRMIG